MRSPRPAGEDRRLAALADYDILDTSPQAGYDELVQLARHICDVPMAMISLVDEARQWFKAEVGLGVRQTPREDSFCAWTILSPEPMVVEDALADPRFRDTPLVLRGPRIRFYAGVPLLTPASEAIGALCVMDTEPRELAPRQLEALGTLARQVMVLLESRRSLLDMTEMFARAEAAEAALRARDVVGARTTETRAPGAQTPSAGHQP